MGRVEGKVCQWTPRWLRFILWLFAVFLTTCEAVNYEGLALQAFKQAIQDPKEALKSWNDTDITPCNWRGIACFNSTDLVKSINLAKLNLSGTIVPQLAELRFLQRISLHHNNFYGGIPEVLQNLTNLRALYLQNNAFSGSIPSGIGGLFRLQILDLSNNKLDGAIPGSFSSLNNLVSLNLSNNQLAGEVPGGALLRFNSSSFLGNIYLCGLPGLGLATCQLSAVPASAPVPAPAMFRPGKTISFLGMSQHRDTLSLLQIILLSVGLFLLFKFMIGVFLIMRWMRLDNHLEINLGSSGKLVMFQGGAQLPSSKEMLNAIRKIRRKDIIGEGGYGVVYKVEFKRCHSTFAVKRLKPSLESERGFENELDTIGTVKHRNLTRLRGFCTAPEVRLLIYDFIPNGNLHQLLHVVSEEGLFADWSIRMRIAIGVARGISYLHHGCNPRIIHGDISASNILLDEDFEPYLTDFGLAKLVGMYDTHVTGTVGGSFGYVAPEYLKTGRTSERVDVYSYGVILLELLTGRNAVDDSFTEEHMNLAGWVRSIYNKCDSSNLVDKRLRETVAHIDLDTVLELACLCVSLTPEDRPKINKVVEILEALVDLENSTQSSSSLRTSMDFPSEGPTSSPTQDDDSCPKTPKLKINGEHFVFEA